MAAAVRGYFYGWVVVWAAFVVAAFGWGIGFYGPPVYLEAVQHARGFSLPLVSTAVTMHFLVGAAVVVNLPRLHRRFGLPAVTVAGAATLALGVVGWAVAREPWQLFAATLLSGSGWVALGAAAINAMVSPWFVRRRPAALATAYNGASVGGIVFAPLWVLLIERAGFPLAAVAVGAVMAVTVGLLSGTILARSPTAMGLAPDGVSGEPATAASPLPPRAAPDLRRDAAFVTLAAGMALGLFAQIGLLAHLFSLLVPAFGAQAAGLVAGLATAAAILGRTAVGWLMPPATDRRLVAALSYGVQAAGCAALLLAGGGSALLILGVLLFGLGIGNATSLPPLIAQAEFAQEDVPRVVARVTGLAQATYALAPAVFGLLRGTDQAAGSPADPAIFLVAAAIQAVAAAAYLSGCRRFRHRRRVPTRSGVTRTRGSG